MSSICTKPIAEARERAPQAVRLPHKAPIRRLSFLHLRLFSSLPFPRSQALRRFAPPSACTLPSRDRLAQASRPSSCHLSQRIAVHLGFDAVTFDREPSTANALFRVVLAHRYRTKPGRSHPTPALSITVPLTHDYRSLLLCLWRSGGCRGR